MSANFSFSDIPALRQGNGRLTGDLAPALTPNMFKSPRCFTKPPAKCMEHRLNLESSSREAATLKAAASDLTSDVISLSTGRPSPGYFPFSSITFDLPKGPDFSGTNPQRHETKEIGKYSLTEEQGSFDLARCLNYGYSAGSEQLVRFVTEHMDVVHDPPYSDWQCALTAGSTAAIDTALRIFCSRGDYILLEDYTYSGVLEAVHPLGIRTASVQMDEYGLCPRHLDTLLSQWDQSSRGAPRPFVLYTVPTGQNPTGVTQSLQRRQDIYAIAEKHDLYIIEDDPYYFLQFQSVKKSPTLASRSESMDGYLNMLIPSYLSMDVSGRVLRLDSTSKTIGPGLRCSWMTGSASIISRFLYFYDTSIVSPSGLSQLAIYTLLDKVWGHNGFIEWLAYLRNEYTQRRDVIVSACEADLPRSICSWNVPESGMFHWIKVDWRKHPLATGTQETDSDTILDIEDRVCSTALTMGVLCCKGSTFCTDNARSKELFLRTTFATASLQQIQEGIARLGKAISAEFIISCA